ncbi:efflux RND transporter periplasmic adaptor subunit [Panacibacter ginsenosidivorans]|uniref:Efflux RND transporter periplasmic adaptor subunit n=2 Tax=Panacibacter ginsenosidivorans TaxID=1813871 RepID=A0A5B8VFB8_9BACT|nr:efflux RND transporter periplasmic adaptor subunit [Panacibacter ginsenosidivorans]
MKNIAVLSSLFITASCGSKTQQGQMQGPPPAVAVTVADVVSTQAIYYDEYPATVTAFNEIQLRPQVTGFVTGIYFKDGDRVKKGQKLYSIDQQQYEANYQQAIANVEVQKTNMLKAQKDADRYHELDKQDAIAKQQVDYADAALEASKKQVEAAEANVRAVQTGVKYTTIFAPFDGTIGISQVKVGAPVSAGQTILNTVSSDNPIAADIAVDQKEIFRFTKLAEQKIQSKDSTFTLAFGDSIYEYPGKISLIDRAVDPQTGTIKMRLEFPNPKSELKAGMTGTIRVLNNNMQKSLLIPYKAVTEQLGEFFVFIVKDSNKVSQQKIILGKQIGTNVIVKSGLTDGDKIAVQGVQNLKEGSSIKLDTTAQKK